MDWSYLMLRVSSLGSESHVFPQFNGIIMSSSSGALFRAGVEINDQGAF